MPLRLRLAFLLAGLIALLSTGASYGVRHSVTSASRARIETELLQETQDLIDANPAPTNPNQTVPAKLVVPAGNQSHPSHIEWFTSACQDLTVFTEQISASVAAGKLLPLSRHGFDELRAGQPFWETVDLPDESGLHMIYNKPILRGNKVIGLAQVAESIEESEQVISSLSQGLLIGGFMLTLGSFAAVWFVAGKVLRPIGSLTNAVETIRDQHDFSAPLLAPSKVGHDEVGQLTQSVQSMLTDLQLVHQNKESVLDYQRRFLADVSHELRTPLTTIHGNLCLLQRNLSAEDRTAVLHDAIDETERMSRLLQKLLATARGEPQPALHCAPLALTSIVDDVMRKVSVVNNNRHIVARIVAHPIVRGDADALKQVLLILVDNALKYTPVDGQVTVSLRCERDQAQISVLDTGPGMAPEQIQHIFERFYRGASVQHTRGAGLGLAIAKELVSAHGGTISVASQLGHGSEFTVSLPLEAPGY